MKILRNIIVLPFLLCLCGCPEQSPFLHPDGDYAYRKACELSRIVPRHSGSEGAKRAAELIARAAGELPGFRVSTDLFEERTPEGMITFRNVSAVLPGKSPDFIVIGAHYDAKKMASVPDFQGANDGGSGVGALLAVMKALSDSGTKPPMELRFVFFDGEEAQIFYTDYDGLHGSRRYVSELRRNGELDRCRAMLLLDMVGDQDLKLRLPPDTDPILQNKIVRSAHELGYDAHLSLNGPQMLDDHTPFMRAGIPAADLIDFEYGPGNLYWHTAGDTIDKLSAKSLGISAAIALKTIRKLTGMEP